MSIDKINMKYLQSKRVRSIQVFLYQEMSKGLYFKTLESNKNSNTLYNFLGCSNTRFDRSIH